MQKIFKNKVGRPSNKTKKRRLIIVIFAVILLLSLIISIYINRYRILNLFIDDVDTAVISHNKVGTYSNIEFSYNIDCKHGYNIRPGLKYKVSTNSNDVIIKYRVGNNKLVTNNVINSFVTLPEIDISKDKTVEIFVYQNGKIINSKQITLIQNGFKGDTYFYNQRDYNVPYCGRKFDTIATSGCGGTSIAIALSNLTQNGKYDPIYVSNYAAKFENDYYCRKDGTSSDGMKAIINGLLEEEINDKLGYKLTLKRMTNESWDPEYYNKETIISEMKKALLNGGQVIVNASKGCYTSGSGHFMSIVGLSADKKQVYLYDPDAGNTEYLEKSYNCKFGDRYSNGWYDINELFSKKGISSTGYFTSYIISKKDEPIVLTCDKIKVNLNEEIKCHVNQANVTIRTSHEDYLDGNLMPLFTSTLDRKSTTFKYNKPANVIIKAYRGDVYTTLKVNVGNFKDTTTKNNSKNYKTMNINCPSSAKVNQEFNCTIDTLGVSVALGGANSLANGYASKMTTGLLSPIISIKYTNSLFTNYKSQIKKDNNGEYIYAYVYAKKSGYKDATKKIKIYNNKVATTKRENSTSLKSFALSCPTSVRVNEEFVCKTDTVGVTIALGGSNSLSSGYNPKFTTTSYDLTKVAKYTNSLFTNYKSQIKKDNNGEYIYAYVYAKKSGYKNITKKVKVYKQIQNNQVNTTIRTTTRNSNNNNNNEQNIYNKYGIHYNITVNGKYKTKEFIITPTFFGNKIAKQSFVVCESKNSCERKDAWDYMKKTYGSGTVTYAKKAKVNNSEYLTLKTTYKGITNKKYYVRATTYDSNGIIRCVFVTEFSIDSNAVMTPNTTFVKYY